jgi:hypothetical protein
MKEGMQRGRRNPKSLATEVVAMFSVSYRISNISHSFFALLRNRYSIL